MHRADTFIAIALNSSMFIGARLIGPAIAGVLVAELGEGICFTIDAISYLAVIAALLMMHVSRAAERPIHKHVLRELADGIAYTFGFAPIRTLLTFVATTSLMSVSYQVLMPVFADRLWAGHGAQMLGILMASVGVGSLAGALYLASRRSVVGLGQVLTIAAALFGCGLIGFALLPFIVAAVPLMFLFGFGMIVHFASSNTVIQTIVDDDKRGRVMSFFTMSLMGMAPFGSLLAGWIASTWSEAGAVAICGTCCVISALSFYVRLPALRALVRPIYIRKGILPQTGTGLEEAERPNPVPQS
jgi:MFS family permease